MKTKINNERLNDANERGNNTYWGFNCWGATLYVLNKAKELKWIDQARMNRFLRRYTSVVENIKKGDIFALYNGNILIHTAIYITKTKLWHKKGSGNSEFTTKTGIYDTYCGDIVQVRRLKV